MSDEIELPDEVDESERGAWDAFVANHGAEYATGENFRDAFAGEWMNLEEYVEESFRDSYEIPDYLDCYIDWESMGRDWELSGDIWTSNASGSSFYVFRSV